MIHPTAPSIQTPAQAKLAAIVLSILTTTSFASSVVIAGCTKTTAEEADTDVAVNVEPARTTMMASAVMTAAPWIPEASANADESLGDRRDGGAVATDAAFCEQAYSGTEAVKKSLEKSKKAGKPLPSKSELVAACKELPEANQKCMVMSYAAAHTDECKQAKQKLDPKRVAKLRKLTGK